MKRYQRVLTIAALVFSTSTSWAGYDEFSCVTNGSMKLSNLQCISCGLTKYYADQGFDVNPSHKWLALLALKVREQKLDSQGNGPARSTEARENLQKQVIRKIQTYGVCNEYLGKDTLKSGRSKNMHDMSAADWKVINEFINRDDVPTEESYDSVAKRFGFKSTGIFKKSGGKKNMDYLFQGFDENLSLDDKRALFKEKLNEALKPEYNVSGDKNEKIKEIIAAGDEDQGLRNCLGEIKRKFFLEKNMTDKETYKMCEVVANACDLARTPMGADDFCVHKGMGLRPVSKAKPLGPPPAPTKNGAGVK